MRIPAIAVFAATVLAASPALSQAREIDLPYEKFTLDNGLRVVVHEDRKAPIVAISIWYHVGGKDEPQGQTGFAHLFEHLMFNGSENHDTDYISALQEIGATGLNGTTWFDRTNYFQDVPTSAVERVLWLESDRMGHLLGVIDQAKLDEQRGVVQNEKRQFDNAPYNKSWYRISEALFPVGHPYRNSVIGSMDDLNAASLEDVHEWFKTYYGPDNAVLVLAGDIDAAEARPLVEAYFGDIPPGPPLYRMESWIPDRTQNTREIMYDSVPQPRILRNWAVPGMTEQENAYLELAAMVLGDGKNSRLYKELVYDRQLADNVSVSLDQREIASVLQAQVDVKAGADLDEINAILDATFAAFLNRGPSRGELERAKTKIYASAVRGLEQVGGFSGKAVTLAQGELYAEDPGFVETRGAWIEAARADDVRTAAQTWLSDGRYQIDILPFPSYAAAETDADRSTPPTIGAQPNFDFPAIEEARLDNGVKVVLARRNAVPVIDVAIQFDAGYAADAGGTLGTASFAMAMLDDGAGRMDALEISAELERLGATLSAGSNLDVSTVTLSALNQNLAESVDLMAEVVQNASFPQGEIDRLRQRWLAQIAQEKAQPTTIALRLLPPALYGADHAYGVPFTGSGTEDSINSLTRDDLVAFRAAWLRPDTATVFVVGDTTMDEALPVLNRAFGNWQTPTTPRGEKNVAAVEVASDARVAIVDKPGSPQSVILAAHLIAPTGDDITLALDTADGVVGGAFFSRLNQNLREDKAWSYGSVSFVPNARGQRPYIIYAPVQTDRTADSIGEILKEYRGFLGDAPATEAERNRVVDNATLALPGQFETASAVLGSLTSSERFGRPYDYPTTLNGRYRALSPDDLMAAARAEMKPDQLLWVIVGDRAAIEDSVRALDLGAVEVWDVDGNRID